VIARHGDIFVDAEKLRPVAAAFKLTPAD